MDKSAGSFFNTRICWCGCEELVQSPHESYLVCGRCGTAVLRDLSQSHQTPVTNEASHLYGEGYWEEHQRAIGLPPIDNRARTDLVDRAQYWIKNLLKYKLPPGRTLEIGCAHGGLVKLLKMAGFDALGIEMSARIIEKAKQWFGVPIRQGPLESCVNEAEKFDLIVMFDVVEHLDRPKEVLRAVTARLADSGVLAIQTPQHQPGLEADWRMYLPPEHTYLFSQGALQELLGSFGFGHIAVEPPVFLQDMFLFASRQRLTINSREKVVESLSRLPDGRMLLAMQDLFDRPQREPPPVSTRTLGKMFFHSLSCSLRRRLSLKK